MHPVSRIALPDAPSLVAGHGRAAILTMDGELLAFPADEAALAVRAMDAPVLVHAPATLRRLGLRGLPCLDVLELFAFVLPARTAAPTPRGLALALDLDFAAGGLEAEVALLPELVEVLLRRLAAGRDLALNRDAAALAARMGQAGWGWAPFVMAALGRSDAAASIEPLRVWKRLPEWEDAAPLPPPSSLPVPEAEARRRLAEMLGKDAEQRPGQADYAGAAATAFAPREARGDPHLVLAEAGTGTGKTLAYIAPASVWAEKNRGTVWLSTFTRHLQRQIDAELSRLYPDPAERRRRVVVRKGRENYLCLLNYEEAVGGATGGLVAASTVPLGLIARWALATADGDIQGGDLPGWFSELFGAATVYSLADRRGECIHAACPHWKRCFVEHTVRRARTAQLVVANHALVMAQAAWGGLDDAQVPTRYVFDEGHHVFDAADGAFSAELSGMETAELRRWLLGAEGGRSRARGLKRRLDELVAERPALEAPLDAALQAARALPAPGWPMRLAEDGPVLAGLEAAGREAGQGNPTEVFLRLLRRQVLARVVADGEPGSRASWGALECDLFPPVEALPEAADRLARALGRIVAPLEILRTRLAARLEDEAEDMDAATRVRIEASCRSLGRRAIDPLTAWRGMLQAVIAGPGEPGVRSQHVMFVRLDRRRGWARRICRPRRSGWRWRARSTTRRRPGRSSSTTWRRGILARWRRRIGRCSWRPAAAGWGCSPRSGGCRRCMRGLRRSWRRRGSRCMRSTSMRWTTRRWSTSSAPRRRAACSAPTRCAMEWMCRGGRCGWWCSKRCRGRGRTFCTGNDGCIFPAAIRRGTTTGSRGCGCARRSGD
jgi:ATP-dependent DNA helicase DinG